MNYQKYADKAYSKIQQYGSPIKIRRSGKKTYDPSTNTYTDSGTEINGFAIMRNYNQHNIDGTNIRMGDVQFMASLDGQPKSNDTITFGTKSYTVVNVDVMNPDGNTDIYFTIQAR